MNNAELTLIGVMVVSIMIIVLSLRYFDYAREIAAIEQGLQECIVGNYTIWQKECR